jgi:hypothetical protein
MVLYQICVFGADLKSNMADLKSNMAARVRLPMTKAHMAYGQVS